MNRLSKKWTRRRARFRPAGAALLVLGLLGGCSARVETAEPEADDPAVEARDYDEVLQRVRDRHGEADSIYELGAAVERFQVDVGRSPTDLIELLETGYLDEMPEAPAGMYYEYDPTNGMVRLNQIPGSSRARLPDLP